MKATYTYGMLIYNTGFLFFKFGEAAAQSWILCLLLVVLTVIVMKLMNRKLSMIADRKEGIKDEKEK